MRARGAKVTDIAVIVVAANDGVMPQTLEAIDHAKAAEVPIVVAINKIDLPDANPDQVKQQLTEQGLVPEEWGGDTVMVEVSAKQSTNLDELMDMILLVAEVQELKANPKAPASGRRHRGPARRGPGPGGDRPRAARHAPAWATPSRAANPTARSRPCSTSRAIRSTQAGPVDAGPDPRLQQRAQRGRLRRWWSRTSGRPAIAPRSARPACAWRQRQGPGRRAAWTTSTAA